MSEFKDKPQQQILFEDVTKEEAIEGYSFLEDQVILENDVISEIVEVPEVVEDELVQNKPNWLWRIALSLFLVLIVIETTEFFILGFSQEPIIAAIYAVLLFILSIIIGRSLLKELTGLRQFKRRQNLQSKVKQHLNNNGEINAKELCFNISKQLPCELSNDHIWNNQDINELSDAEVLRLYSRQVLTQVDQKALDKIGKFSMEATVLVALSPIAILDMMLMLWRNFKLIDEIAHLYGLRLSYWSRIRLFKHVITNMAFVGATELIADLGTELLSADLLGKLSVRFAQGLGAGMLTARLGLKTLTLCRPIPFESAPPKIKDVRQKLIVQLKQLLTNRATE